MFSSLYELTHQSCREDVWWLICAIFNLSSFLLSGLKDDNENDN